MLLPGTVIFNNFPFAAHFPLGQASKTFKTITTVDKAYCKRQLLQ